MSALSLLSTCLRARCKNSFKILQNCNKMSVSQLHSQIHNAKDAQVYVSDFKIAADHTGRQQNHIWNKEEISTKLNELTHHEPKTITDKVVNKLVRNCHH